MAIPPDSSVLHEAQRARLTAQLASLELLLANASPASMNRRPASGKWSARENLAHLARYHEIFRERIRRILAETAPEFPRYRAEDDADWPAWAALPVEESKGRLVVLRDALVSEVTAVSLDEFSRIGVHSSFGRMPLSLWLEFFLLHEAHHLYIFLQLIRGRA